MIFNNITAKYVKVETLNGAAALSSVIKDTATSPEDVDFSKKTISGKMEVQEAALTNLKGQAVQGLFRNKDQAFRNLKHDLILTFFADLLDSFGKWSKPGVVKGPMSVKNLNLKTLETPRGLRLEMPAEMQEVIFQGNLAVGNINGVNFASFIDNVVQLDQEYSINHATFRESFSLIIFLLIKNKSNA